MGDKEKDRLLLRIAGLESVNRDLAEENSRYRIVLENHFQLTGIVSTDGKIISANKAALNMVGKKSEDVVGQYFWETPWFKHSKELQIRLRKAIEKISDTKFERFEATHIDTQGKLHEIDFSIRYVKDELTGISCLIAEGRDITELKKTRRALAESEERYKNIFNAISDAIFIIDQKGIIRDANPAASDIYGYEKEALLGSHATILIRPEYHKAFKIFVDELSTKGSCRLESIDLKKDGSHINTVVRGTTIQIAGEPRYVGIVSNVTNEKKAEQEREMLIQELQDALNEINALSGIIPICASCKKIRDDQGYWNMLESYIETHSTAFFSHGLCPECSDKLYGDKEWYQKRKKKKDP